MKNLILALIIAIAAMFLGTQTANGGEYCCESEECCVEESECCEDECNECCGGRFSCIKRKRCTEEIDRNYFTKTKCFCGCEKTIRFVEITYQTTYADRCGNCSYKTFKQTRRCCR